jgi:dodecin
MGNQLVPVRSRPGRQCAAGPKRLRETLRSREGENAMPDRVYKKVEITGTSTTSLEDAVKSAVERAAKTVRKLRWFEVVETRGRIDDGKVAEWQVTVKIGFALEDE